MASHLAAFFSVSAPATLTELNALTSESILTRISATRYAVPGDYSYVGWAAATGNTLTRAQLNSPTLQVRRSPIEIIPREQDGAAFQLTSIPIFIPPRPIPLTPTEDFEVLTAISSTAAQNIYGLVSLQPAQRDPMPDGIIRSVRGTATTTLTTFQWTVVSLTLDQGLEPGQYTLVDFIPISGGCVAARALITGQVYRPGLPGLSGTEASAAQFDDANRRAISYYAMGSFNHLNIPQFEFLSNTADTSETVIMRIIRTGDALLTPSGTIAGAGPAATIVGA